MKEPRWLSRLIVDVLLDMTVLDLISYSDKELNICDHSLAKKFALPDAGR